jgi:hypothetical protein
MSAKKNKFKDPSKINDWVQITSQISPQTLEEALDFCKENRLVFAQLLNSSIKVFISETKEYYKEQARHRSKWMTEPQKTSKDQEAFRVTDALTTEDALRMKDKIHLDPRIYETLYGRRNK